MSLYDWGIVSAGAVLGWLLVSALMRRARPAPARTLPAPSQAPPPGSSLSELAARWHEVLGVSPDASAMAIEIAYQARCGEARRRREHGAAGGAEAERLEGEALQAYQFIRRARGSAP